MNDKDSFLPAGSGATIQFQDEVSGAKCIIIPSGYEIVEQEEQIIEPSVLQQQQDQQVDQDSELVTYYEYFLDAPEMPPMGNEILLVSHSLDIPQASSAVSEKPQSLTPERMIEYIQNRRQWECVATLRYPNVVQKSYGQEKRRICPPPCIRLRGDGWIEKKRQTAEMYEHCEERRKFSKSSLQGCEAEPDRWVKIAAYVSVGEPTTLDREHVDFTNDDDDYGTATSAYVSDTFRQKYCALNLELFYECGFKIGTFTSNKLKIVAKPSKRKQEDVSAGGTSVCFQSGAKVALFNRVRSKTRYLHVDGDAFHASETEWSGFQIYLFDHEKEEHYVEYAEGYIHYGDTVKLVDCESEITLPNLRIVKVDKQGAVTNYPTKESVSQLQKCAFQLVNEDIPVSDNLSYLCINDNQIVVHTATRESDSRHKLDECASWTIISTGEVEYRFFEAMGTVRNAVTPIPAVTGLNFFSKMKTVELKGRNFRSNLKVWFAATPVDTVCRSEEIISCAVPDASNIRGLTEEACNDSKVEVPLFLVRDDGVIYPTEQFFTYRWEP